MVGTFDVAYNFKAKDVSFSNVSRGIQRELKETSRAAKVSTKQLVLMNKGMVAITSGIRTAGLSFAAFFGARATISTLATFSDSMARVRAVSQGTAEDFFILREQAKKLGETTRFSASEAAQGMAFLGQAGFDMKKIFEAMPQVLTLAAAANMDLATAADITSNIMSGFGSNAAETQRIVDLLAVAAARTNTNVQQIGQAMKNAAPVSKSFGLSMEETVSILGVFADTGIQAGKAGTDLNRVLSRLATPTKAARKILARYNITQEDLNFQSLGFSEVMKRIQPILKNQTAAFKVFGQRGVVTAAILGDNIDRLDELKVVMQGSEGQAKKMATTMEDTLGGDIRSLKSAVQGLTLSTGDRGLVKGFRVAIQTATLFTRAMAGSTEAVKEMNIATRALFEIVTSPKWIGVGLKKISFFGEERKQQREIFERMRELKEESQRRKAAVQALDVPITERVLRTENRSVVDINANFGNLPPQTNIMAEARGDVETNLGMNMQFAGGV